MNFSVRSKSVPLTGRKIFLSSLTKPFLSKAPKNFAPLQVQVQHFSDNRQIGRGSGARLTRMSSIELIPSVNDDPKEMITSLSELQTLATKERVPWFQSVMPSSYFHHVPEERRLRHLVAVAAVPDIEDIPEMVYHEFQNDRKTRIVSVISNGRENVGRIEKQLEKVPDQARLHTMNFYTSTDQLLSITEFVLDEYQVDEFQRGVDDMLPDKLVEYAQKLQNGEFETDRKQFLANTGEILHASPASHLDTDNLLSFVRLSSHAGFAERTSPRRLCKFAEMYQELLQKGTDEVHIDVESNWEGDRNKFMYTMALSNAIVKPTLSRLSTYFESKGMVIERVHLDRVSQDRVHEDSESYPEYNDVSFLRILAHHDEPTPDLLDEMKASIPLISKWYDDKVLSCLYNVRKRHQFARDLHLKPVDLEILTGLLECVHLVKSGTEMYEFSKPNVYTVIHRPQAFAIVDLFKRRFNPFQEYAEQTDDVFKARAQEIRDNYYQYVEVDRERRVLDKMLDIVQATIKTNIYSPDRFGFSLKLDPEVCMDAKDTLRTETPYGVYFVNGRRFSGVHIRFREIARGGLRLVTPNSEESLTIESTRQFAECYDLAYAQQLKNKDIAEGGSKAVILIDVADTQPESGLGQERSHILRKCVKAFVNSVLDLITITDTNKTEELIFFGPDEQISIEHINWIVRRAAERNYRMPTAFMSSKPEQGINHKEFGVTSEGVAVFLDTALKSLDMLPSATNNKEFFTVKITGGPDGDVAGNMLKILYREYGDKCRVVGLADGTGCVEDVNGIDWDELLRLVKESKPLNMINKSKLASTTEVFTLEKAEGVHKRNTMHNRVQADAFIPGGGRPATINQSNWDKFLVEKDGKKVPSSALIVEGANLFLTNEARKNLSELGCVVVKDSSANKCGVICSSFEIISCMLLEKPEFLAIKPVLVPQVVERLRAIARKEAELLMTEYRKNTTAGPDHVNSFNLVNVSIEVSHTINRTTDCVRAKLETMFKEDPSAVEEFMPLVKAFLPQALVEAGWKNFHERVPLVYVTNLVSTILACELVYHEGTDFVSAISDDKVLTETAINYIRQKNLVLKLVDELESGKGMSEADSMAVRRLLELGGPRAALNAGGVDRLRSNL